MNEEEQLHKLLVDVDLSGLPEKPAFDLKAAEAKLSSLGKDVLKIRRVIDDTGVEMPKMFMLCLLAELSLADLDIIADITLHEIALVRGETFAQKVDQEINAQLESITREVFRKLMDGLF